MPLIFVPTSQLLWARVAALLCTCTAFSAAAHGGSLPSYVITDWCIFCWAFGFAFTLLVLLAEAFGFQARVPVSWNNFPITVASYSAHLCLAASILFPLTFLRGQTSYLSSEVQGHRVASTVFSCLATLAYVLEVSLTKARPGEVAGYMATAPGLLKVCQTTVACVIFIYVSSPVSYDSHPALEWCMAVYCICFILSMAVVLMCVGGCTGYLPVPLPKFLSVYALLAVAMYLTATILWPVFQFSKASRNRNWKRNPRTDLIVVAVLTAVNFLLYLADLAYSARLVFVSVI
ncbi:myeloid-associated differentiation marker homolog [Gadus macrocephalus]|uniref:myeloid-associated differentiation marker homolog n=1 Tax=Gadus macrocephalus TaxID=80720 RepID=UPI0028CB2877|nr:myeloid-associated differentiation marker homolog [Gadus macrocephalus]